MHAGVIGATTEIFAGNTSVLNEVMGSTEGILRGQVTNAVDGEALAGVTAVSV